jgi:hypothetical protein
MLISVDLSVIPNFANLPFGIKYLAVSVACGSDIDKPSAC